MLPKVRQAMGDEFQNNLVQNNRFGTAVDKLYDIGIYDEAPEYEGGTHAMDPQPRHHCDW